MEIVTHSGAVYITVPDEGHYVFINDGVSETFTLTVIRPADEGDQPIKTYPNCHWLSPVEIGGYLKIFRADDRRIINSTSVVSIH